MSKKSLVHVPTLFMSLTDVKKMSDWSFKCFGMWHHADGGSKLHQKVGNCSSASTCFIFQKTLKLQQSHCENLNMLQDEWSHIYVGRAVWTNTIMCAMFLLQFTCIPFAKILHEIMKVSQINEHTKKCTM